MILPLFISMERGCTCTPGVSLRRLIQQAHIYNGRSWRTSSIMFISNAFVPLLIRPVDVNSMDYSLFIGPYQLSDANAIIQYVHLFL